MEQVVANGLYLGAQYALIALGLTLIFALMNVMNFAHGQMYVLGGSSSTTLYGQMHLPFVVALPASAVTLAILGALLERFLFRRSSTKRAGREHHASGRRRRLFPRRRDLVPVRREATRRVPKFVMAHSSATI